jgi:hypothetical protein
VTNSFCFPKGKARMKITQSLVTVTPTGFEQELSYLHSGKLRREQFVGRSREHLGKIVAERRAELKRERQ